LRSFTRSGWSQAGCCDPDRHQLFSSLAVATTTDSEIIYDRGAPSFRNQHFLNNYAKFAIPTILPRALRGCGAEKLSQSVRDLWSEKFGYALRRVWMNGDFTVISVNSPMATRIGSVGQLLPEWRPVVPCRNRARRRIARPWPNVMLVICIRESRVLVPRIGTGLAGM